MRVKILALILLGVLLTAPFTQMACAASVESGAGEPSDFSADEEKNSKVTETVFNSIKSAAETRRDEAFSKMSEDLPPSVLSDISKALNLMEEAEGSEATDMSGATQLYMQAMKLFRDSWNYIDDGDTFVPPGETSGSEPVLVEEQNENLNEEILIAKQQLLLRFQTNFQNRIETMYSHIQDLNGAMDPEDSAKAENALVSAVEKLREVQKNITDGNLEDALLELDATSNGLEDEFKSLKDKETADLIVTVDKLEGKVQKLTEENTRSSGKNGSDTPEDTSDEAKVTEEPKPKEEPKVTEEPKGNSGSSGSSSSGSTVNGDSQRNSSKSMQDQINDLKEKIRKSLEDFREKKSQQTSDNNSNSAKNGNDNGNGNGNSSDKSKANSAENSNGNSNGNSSKNNNSNGNGNGNSKENQGKSKNH